MTSETVRRIAPAGYLGGFAAMAFFCLSLLAINVLQVASLLVRPFSQPLFRAVNRELADTWWSWLVIWMERVRGVEIEFSGDEVPPLESVLLIANHQQMPDILVLMALGYRKRRLGDMKWFVKEPLKHVPGLGWGMRFLDCVFLKRDWNKDRAGIERTFSRLKGAGIPFWLVSFVEGTRIRPSKLAKSQEYARSHGMRVPRHVLIPRTKGFAACIQGLGDRMDAVYDATIAFHGEVEGLWKFFCGSTRKVSVHLRRTPIGEIPRSEAELSAWLLKRFEEKDELLERFRSQGSF